MKKNRKTLLILVGVGLFMFIFAFANVPFYNMFCRAIGFNLSPDYQPGDDRNAAGAGDGREIKVLYTGVVAGDLPVSFKAKKSVQKAIVGQTFENEYRFVNLSSDTVYFRPVHSILPEDAAKKFTMVKCFCFDDMTMAPGEERVIPVISTLDPSLGPEIQSVTLHYTLFEKSKEDFKGKDGVSTAQK